MTENKQFKLSKICLNNPNVIHDNGEPLTQKEVVDLLNKQEETIQLLKKELFESEKDYIMETYSDNPIRRDEKIQLLKEEFKARFW